MVAPHTVLPPAPVPDTPDTPASRGAPMTELTPAVKCHFISFFRTHLSSRTWHCELGEWGPVWLMQPCYGMGRCECGRLVIMPV